MSTSSSATRRLPAVPLDLPRGRAGAPAGEGRPPGREPPGPRRPTRRRRGSRFEPVSHAEAAAFGHALLASIRQEPLSDGQRRLLDRAGSDDPRDARAPGPVEERAERLLVLPRAGGAELRVSLRRFRGSAPFLDLRRWERGAGGGLLPTRQGVTVRAAELGRLLGAVAEAAGREPGAEPKGA